MDPDQFYQSRKQEWELLNALVEKAQKDVKRLSTRDIERFASLYRATSSDLALARRDFPGHHITQYLNHQVARAHSILYQGEALAVNRIVNFAVRGFPQLFRGAFIYTLAAFLMFAIPAVTAGLGVSASPKS